jgi:hypothetical protein
VKQVKIPSQTESSIGAAFVKKVKKHAPATIVVKLKGDGRRDLPDYMVLTEGGRAIFIEMKRPGKQPTLRQRNMLSELRSLGFAAAWMDNAETAFEYVLMEEGG